MACEAAVGAAVIGGVTLSGLTFLLAWCVRGRVASWDNEPRYHGGDQA